MTTNTRRAIIILHPTFDDPETGFNAAKDQAQEYTQGLEMIFQTAKQQGAPAEDLAKLKEILSKYEIKIQQLPVELLT